MREIVRGVWALEGLKMGRSYLIEDRDGLALIDSSSPGVAGRIIAAIERIGRRVEELHTIVVTHYHYDHTGNAEELRRQSGAQIVAHAADEPYIDGRKPWGTGRPNPLAPLAKPLLVQPFTLTIDRTLRDGDTIMVDGGMEVIHTSGHTPGEIALLAKDRGVLFAGDTFMNTFGLQLPPPKSTHDMDAARRSVRRLCALDFDHALPGHGNPIINHAAEKLRMWASRWLPDSD